MPGATHKAEVLIVGAGLAGLTAANELLRHGIRAVVVDKGRSVGGRLATRRIGPGRADHGAQFFTARDARFRQAVAAWVAEGLVYEWSRGWSDGSLVQAPTDGHPRYAVHGGMNQLAKRLAQPLEQVDMLHTGLRIAKIYRDTSSIWCAETDDGRLFHAPSILLTPPAPQALDLLDAGAVPLHKDDRQALAAIHYAPCLCGLYWVDGDVRLPDVGAMQMPHAAITWIADNRRKGISPAARIVTIHAGPEWSERHYDEDDATILDRLRAELLPLLRPASVLLEAQIKRWRYALPTAVYPQAWFAPRDLPGCLLGGDGFGSPRVEGAYLSGLALGEEALRQSLWDQ